MPHHGNYFLSKNVKKRVQIGDYLEDSNNIKVTTCLVLEITCVLI